MKLREFVDKYVELLTKYDCGVELTEYDYRLNDLEIVDSFNLRFRFDFMSNYPTGSGSCGFSFYNENDMIKVRIRASNMSCIDAFTAIIEMGFPRLFIYGLARIKEDKHLTFYLSEIVDEVVLNDNDDALSIILNTNYDMICREDLYCTMVLSERRSMFNGHYCMDIDTINVLYLKCHVIESLIEHYPDSTKCIPLLLRYKHDHFGCDDDDLEDL